MSKAPSFHEAEVEGRIITTRAGLEAMVFEIPLGFMKLVCIVNIPEEGAVTAPVYLKFKRHNQTVPKAAKRPPRQMRMQEAPETYFTRRVSEG